MRTAIISGIDKGMAKVVYGTRSKEASNAMPILDSPSNKTLKPGDRVIVAALNGKKDGIVLGRYWNVKNQPKEE